MGPCSSSTSKPRGHHKLSSKEVVHRRPKVSLRVPKHRPRHAAAAQHPVACARDAQTRQHGCSSTKNTTPAARQRSPARPRAAAAPPHRCGAGRTQRKQAHKKQRGQPSPRRVTKTATSSFKNSPARRSMKLSSALLLPAAAVAFVGQAPAQKANVARGRRPRAARRRGVARAWVPRRRPRRRREQRREARRGAVARARRRPPQARGRRGPRPRGQLARARRRLALALSGSARLAAPRAQACGRGARETPPFPSPSLPRLA